MATTFSIVKHENGFAYMEKIICFKLVHEMSLFHYLLSEFLFYLSTSRRSPLNNTVSNVRSGFQSDGLSVALASAVDCKCLCEQLLGKVSVLGESNTSKKRS